jgi:predicted dehydrogenase
MTSRKSKAVIAAAGVAMAAALGLAQTKRMHSRLIIVDPGHFHATLLQKEMYPWLDRRVSIYAPLGPDLLDYLGRVTAFNTRNDNPTAWELDVHTSNDPMAAMLRDRPGNIVVFTGKNRAKIDRILAALRAGLNVLADKPWIITSADLPKLEEALRLAREKKVAAYDIMTERYEITSEVQRELVSDPAIFGEPVSVKARSVHNVMKVVAGVPLRRPAWFFDIDEYGEGLADVGTHVVDLVQWTLFPDRAIDWKKDVQIVRGRRWPLTLTKDQFAQVTGETRKSGLDYYCNNEVEYTLRGVPVSLEITWEWEAPPGAGDVYEASFLGTKSRVEIRQGAPEMHVPELYVVASADDVVAAVQRRVKALASRWPGIAVGPANGEMRIEIPEKYRVGHEAHFAQVTNRFVDYVNAPEAMPAWEDAYMMAKYYVSTKGVEVAR